MRDQVQTNGLSWEQRRTAIGVLTPIVASQFIFDWVNQRALLLGAIGYGIGSASAIGFYRMASLFKNGSAEQNSLSQGLQTGAALLFGLLCTRCLFTAMDMASPALSQTTAAICIGAGVVGGFLQSRSSFVTSLLENFQGADEGKSK